MNKLFLIAFSNMKKKKCAMITIAILIAFSTFLSYVSISTLTNLKKNAVLSYNHANVADVELLMPEILDEYVTPVLDEREEISDMEKNSCLVYHMGKYKKNTEDDTKDYGIVVQKISQDYRINKNTCEINKEDFPENGIILGQYMGSSGEFKAGDSFYLIINNNTYEFEVVGFSENAMFATPLNLNYQIVGISDSMYEKLEKETEELMPNVYDYKIKVKENISSNKLEKDIQALLTAKIPNFANYPFCVLNWETMSLGVIIMPYIAMSIILVFAILLMLIAISIVYYNIKNFMDENLPNIGILKATGYTSHELILSLLVELSIVTLIGIVIGLVAGFVSAPFVGSLEAAMMGILWRIGIDPVAAILASLLVFTMILLITLILGKKYKSIFVLDALRGGISTYNFKKNHFPLDSSRLSLLGNLGIKDIFFEKRKNICIMIIVVFLTFASCAGVFIYEAFGMKPDNILLLSGIEISDIIVTTSDARFGELELTTIEGVKDVLYHNNMDMTLMLNGKEATADCDVWNDLTKLKNEMLCEGRLPVNDNEIVISALIADELDAKVGDIVYAKTSAGKVDYMIVGIDQKINHLGRKALMSFDGIHRFKEDVEPSGIYIECEDGYDYDSLKDVIQGEFPTSSLGEGQKIITTLISGVQNIMFMICALFLSVTLFIVFIILIIVGKSRIFEKRQQLGIYKALGFTTSQLVRQNIISTIPVVFTGGLLGMLIAYYCINPLMGICFSMFGMSSCSFPIQPLGFLAVVLGITFEAFVVTLLASVKIKDIEPINMIRAT